MGPAAPRRWFGPGSNFKVGPIINNLNSLSGIILSSTRKVVLILGGFERGIIDVDEPTIILSEMLPKK